MLVVVWEYVVRADQVEAFEAMYRPDGPWVELFRAGPGFVSTTLMKDVSHPRRYLIADRWTSEESYEAFKREHAAAYNELSARGERLHRAEHLIGKFDFVE